MIRGLSRVFWIDRFSSFDFDVPISYGAKIQTRSELFCFRMIRVAKVAQIYSATNPKVEMATMVEKMIEERIDVATAAVMTKKAADEAMTTGDAVLTNGDAKIENEMIEERTTEIEN